MDAEKDLIEVIALTSSTSLLLYGAARAAHKPGTSRKGENVLLAVAAGGLVASGLRLAAKSILKKQKHEDPHYFPALILIRSVLRQSLRKDSLPRRSIQDSPVQPWYVQVANEGIGRHIGGLMLKVSFPACSGDAWTRPISGSMRSETPSTSTS